MGTKAIHRIKMKGVMIPVGTSYMDDVTHGKDGVTLEDNGAGLIIITKTTPTGDGKATVITTGVPIGRLDFVTFAPETITLPKPEDSAGRRGRPPSSEAPAK